ncbi:transcription regulator hth gntr [Trichococcus palustris]|uniref:Transcription regulator hth gntr n=1 Tax=Trichococcus palustris TaxID=140314 RepID=A0A143YYJ5_9LACT|nr:GntR family transcriptional regulator [Trichococcus palustris]CZQ99933.1 transcription regulator hth gntr [Trichococcus palustris]SFL19569.1 DNA-binding transcriptional regulator, GntR family [Trichococcus palustris]
MEEYIEDVIRLTDLSQNKPLNQIVFEGLRLAIIKGIIPVGERINEKEYALRMNISRTPIREALRRIEDEGLVEYIPNYGTVVKKVTVADAKEIYDIREALEIMATTNAMNIMATEEFDELEALLAKTEKANNEDDIDLVIQCFSEFNSLIYHFSRMPRLESIVKKLKDYVARFRDISLADYPRREEALLEHYYILNSMKKKDYEQVALTVREHLRRSERFVVEELERRESAADSEKADLDETPL